MAAAEGGKEEGQLQAQRDRAQLTALRAEEALEHDGPALDLFLAIKALAPGSGVTYIPRLEYVAYAALARPMEKRIIPAPAGRPTVVAVAFANDPERPHD